METGQAPACAHSCVGRIRYMGVLLYDADRIPDAAMASDGELLAAHNETLLDPHDPQVIAAAKANGIGEDWLETARQSPVYKFVKTWGLALPLHPEYRTMAMMYYIPPLSPVISTIENELVRLDLRDEKLDFEMFQRLETSRMPIQYLANLFSVGDEAPIRNVLRKMLAVRIYMRHKTVDQKVNQETLNILSQAGLDVEEAEAIYKLTTQPKLEERFVLPPYHREMAVEAWKDPLAHKGDTGIGYIQSPLRGE
jgi:nitrate reductase beta subunit